MNARALLRDVGRRKHLRPYLPICEEFLRYLQVCAVTTYDIPVVGRATGQRETLHIPRYNRYHPVYRNMVYAKFCKLRDNCPPGQLGMLTLTVSGRKYTAFEAWEILKLGWNKISKLLRKYVPGLEYVRVFEAHRGHRGRPGRNYGYPHMHVLVWGDVSESLVIRLKRAWSERYEYGSFERGLTYAQVDLDDRRNVHYYLMKYVTKDAGTDIIEDGAELVFHALAWRSNHRLWDSSAGIKRIMARDEEPPKYRLADDAPKRYDAFVYSVVGTPAAEAVHRLSHT